MALKIEDLTGGYPGINVIKSVDLTIESGQAVGLIGLNGTGKSTTIKYLLGLLRVQKGKITLNGISLTENSAEFKKMVTRVPKAPILYPELTLEEHLELVTFTYGLDHDQAWVRAKELCKMFRLENKLDWLPIKFSRGMKQKVVIATSFLASTDFLAIDESFIKLDPLAIANFIDPIKRVIADQRMILTATHVLAEAQEAIQTFTVLSNGTIETAGNLAEIRQFCGLKLGDSFDRLYQILNQKTAEKYD